MNIDTYLNQHEQKDLLRFITCGSVDDGKSTLIGRLLYDSKLIFEDQLSTLRKDSEKNGTTGSGEIDYALLLDGLKAEREQGITIDVAYRYFSTPKRKFIIADTPGHEQYTRNMATGASTANLAIILIDARYGVVTQTRRHAFIAALLGIKHLVVAVNKMDLVDYDQEVFNTIREEFVRFISRLLIPEVVFIPLSALKGENVVAKSEKMPWHEGTYLLDFLENVDVAHDQNLTDFRFPVQYVIRPHLDFRGFAGSVYSGVVKVGDRIRVLPSQKESAVKRIVTADGDLDEAFPPQAVTIELEDEIDVSSGDMLVHPDNPPQTAANFEAVGIWMIEEPLEQGLSYLLRHAGRNVKARIDRIISNIDVNTLANKSTASLKLNEIGRLAISTTRPLYFDAYSKNRGAGSFILIHPVTNTTVAAGMIVDDDSLDAKLSGTTRGTIVNALAGGLVKRRERILRNRHQGRAVAVVGADSNAVQNLARRLEKQLFNLNFNSYYLSFDDAEAEREKQLRRIGEQAAVLTDAGLISITALPGADELELKLFRDLNLPDDLLVVNIGAPVSTDVAADMVIDLDSTDEEHFDQVIKALAAKNIIPEYCI